MENASWRNRYRTVSRSLFPALLCLICAFPLAAQSSLKPVPTAKEESSASISLGLLPSLLVPLPGSSELFTMGGGSTITAEYGFAGQALRPFAGLYLYYGLAPFKAAQSLSLISGEAAGGVDLKMTPRMYLRGMATAGYSYDMINQDGTALGHVVFSGGLGVSYLLTPFFDLRLNASYRNYLGLYHGVAVDLGASFYLQGRQSRQARIEEGLPIRPDLLQGAKQAKPGSGVELGKVELDQVFPVFKSFYDTNPVGRATLVNRENKEIGDLKLSFFVKQFMDAPKQATVPERLGPGRSGSADILALFTEKILGVTEATKVNAELVLEYRLDGELYRDVRNVTLRVLDRNAMNWSDDARAAAFVTAKDPTVLTFAKNTTAVVRGGDEIRAIDPTLLAGLGIFEALDLYGLAYVVDPKTPYAEYSKNQTAVDYLQFPRQTFQYRAGDCDDLSILYAALLESIGVETAFITVPGHILMAFATELAPQELGRTYTTLADFIIRDGKVWVPVETTIRRSGFLKAWQEGARQWREFSAKNSAAFIPIRESWKRYEPVGLGAEAVNIAMPATDSIAAAYLRESVRLIDRELLPKLKALETEVARQGSPASSRVKLGVLYAKYGDLAKAEEQFKKVLAAGENLGALVNLGNVQFLRKDFPAAMVSYQRAAKLGPSNPMVLLALAKVFYEQEKYDQATSSYKKLAAADQALAERFAYLGESGSTNRAGATDGKRAQMVWNE